MKNLKQALFERDLSEAEFESLIQECEASDQASMELSEMAGKQYKALGLPEPGPSMLGKALPFVGSLAAGLGVVWLLSSMISPAPAPLKTLQSTAPLTAEETHAQARPRLVGARPEAKIKALPPSFSLKVQQEKGASQGVVIQMACQSAIFIGIDIEDMQGRKVRSLGKRVYEKGDSSVLWDLKNEQGALISAGIYYVRMEYTGGMERRALEIERIIK
jgi:hypothetical protein